ncbi:MAG: transcriptional regulator [Polyangiaceae bacterium]|nr:transcriptional regulator [Polyangiaceae bacterium]
MTLRLVKPEGPKPPRQKGSRPHQSLAFTPEEQRKLRQAIRNLKDAFGTWACLADALAMPVKSLENAVRGRSAGPSPAVVIRAMRASGLGLSDLLGAPAPAERCRTCGQIKRRVA